MNENEEVQLRLQVLQLAIPSSATSERKEEVVARAEIYLTFLKGNTNG